jgi:hypothetical protein
MKKSLLFLFVLVLMQAGALMAQPGGQGGPGGQPVKPEEMAKKSADRITKELNLNKTESEKIYQIELERFTAFNKQMQSQPKGGNERPDFSAMKKIDEARDKKMSDLLGEERFKKLKDAEKEMRPPEPPKQ